MGNKGFTILWFWTIASVISFVGLFFNPMVFTKIMDFISLGMSILIGAGTLVVSYVQKRYDRLTEEAAKNGMQLQKEDFEKNSK